MDLSFNIYCRSGQLALLHPTLSSIHTCSHRIQATKTKKNLHGDYSGFMQAWRWVNTVRKPCLRQTHPTITWNETNFVGTPYLSPCKSSHRAISRNNEKTPNLRRRTGVYRN